MKFYGWSLIFIVFLFCCQNPPDQQPHNREDIIEVNHHKKYYVQTSDSAKALYGFFSNKNLRHYGKVNGEKLLNGQLLSFFNDGSLKSIESYSEGLLNGVKIKFYPSGNIEFIRNYERDSIRGYYVSYYDKMHCIKAEYLASKYSLRSYIYKRTYDSTTQSITSVIDHRSLELQNHPMINEKDLVLPWDK